MRVGIVALAVASTVGLAAASCGGSESFGCKSDESCSGGACLSGFCAFPDSDCESGLRWGDLSEEFSGMCVPPMGETDVPEPTTSGPPATTTGSSDGSGTATGSTSTPDGTSTGSSTSTTTTSTGDSSSESSSGGEPLPPDLIAWWRLDEGAGNIAFDSGPLDNAGLLSGGTMWGDGQIAGGLSFDGVDGAVQISPNEAYELPATLTLAAWVYVVAPATVANPCFIYRSGAYELRLSGGSLAPELLIRDPDANEANTFGNVECSGPDLALDTWTHVAGTYDVADRTLRLYVNGVQVCDLTTTGGAGTVQLSEGGEVFLGRRGVGNGGHLNGALDDVRIYRVALSQPEIMALATGS